MKCLREQIIGNKSATSTEYDTTWHELHNKCSLDPIQIKSCFIFNSRKQIKLPVLLIKIDRVGWRFTVRTTDSVRHRSLLALFYEQSRWAGWRTFVGCQCHRQLSDCLTTLGPAPTAQAQSTIIQIQTAYQHCIDAILISTSMQRSDARLHREQWCFI